MKYCTYPKENPSYQYFTAQGQDLQSIQIFKTKDAFKYGYASNCTYAHNTIHVKAVGQKDYDYFVDTYTHAILLNNHQCNDINLNCTGLYPCCDDTNHQSTYQY